MHRAYWLRCANHWSTYGETSYTFDSSLYAWRPCSSPDIAEVRCYPHPYRTNKADLQYCSQANAKARAATLECTGTHFFERTTAEDSEDQDDLDFTVDNYGDNTFTDARVNDFYRPCDNITELEAACVNHNNFMYCDKNDAKSKAVELGCDNSGLGYHAVSRLFTTSTLNDNLWSPCGNEASFEYYKNLDCNNHATNTYCEIEDAEARAVVLGCNGTHDAEQEGFYRPCQDAHTLISVCYNLESNTFCSQADAELRAATLGCSDAHVLRIGYRSQHLWKPCSNEIEIDSVCKNVDASMYCNEADALARAAELGCIGAFFQDG